MNATSFESSSLGTAAMKEEARKAWLADLDKQRREQRAQKKSLKLHYSGGGGGNVPDSTDMFSSPQWLHSNPKSMAYRMKREEESEIPQHYPPSAETKYASPPQQQQPRQQQHQQQQQKQQPPDFFWSHREGGGGGGEPVRDSQGRTITARRRPESVLSSPMPSQNHEPQFVRRSSFTNPQGDHDEMRRRNAAAMEWQESLKQQMAEKKERERKEKEYLRDDGVSAKSNHYINQNAGPVESITGMSRRRRFVDPSTETDGGAWGNQQQQQQQYQAQNQYQQQRDIEDVMNEMKAKPSLLPRARASPVPQHREPVAMTPEQIRYDTPPPQFEPEQQSLPALSQNVGRRQQDQSPARNAQPLKNQRSPAKQQHSVPQGQETQSPNRQLKRILDRARKAQSRDYPDVPSLSSLVKAQSLKSSGNGKGQRTLLDRVTNSNKAKPKPRAAFGSTVKHEPVERQKPQQQQPQQNSRLRAFEKRSSTPPPGRRLPQPPSLRKSQELPESPRRLSHRVSGNPLLTQAPPPPKFSDGKPAAGVATGRNSSLSDTSASKVRPPWGVEGDTHSSNVSSVRLLGRHAGGGVGSGVGNLGLGSAPWATQEAPPARRQRRDDSNPVANGRPPWGTDADLPNRGARLAIEGGHQRRDDQDETVRRKMVSELMQFTDVLADEQRYVYER